MAEKKEFLLHDEELEIYVLGSLLWSCTEGNFDAFYDARLTPDLFFYKKNETIFRIIIDLIKSGIIPDQMTIMEKVNTEGIKDIDAADVVVHTEWHPGQEVNFAEHVRILRDYALRRKLQALAQHLANGSKDPTVEIEKLIEEIDTLKDDAEKMAFSVFSPFYKGANKDRIRALLIASVNSN